MSEQLAEAASGRLSAAADNLPPSHFSARDAAVALGVHERTIRRAIARGALPATKHAGVYRVSPSALARYRSQPRHRVHLPPIAPRRAAPHAPPAPLTPLVDRDAEATTARALLLQPEVRLVTLTGPGGVGKTRLARRIADESIDDFRDGVAFVELALIRDPALIGSAIAPALGVRESRRPLMDAVTAHLRTREMLLVLDNVEHLLAAVPVISELLGACPRLKILATSRALLRVTGEHHFPVPPLALPDPADPPERLAEAEAVRLFVARARAVRPDFAVTAESAPAVAAICRRVDGLPLAIELAAARLRHLSLESLLGRMDRRLPLLTDGPRDEPARLRTMRDAIAWSHELLSPAEQTLFRRLSVFIGGFTLDAAEAVVRDDPDGESLDADAPVLDLIGSLVDKSLLQPEAADGETRYAMLETIREFGQDRLAESGEEAAVRDRHAAWCRRLAARELPFPLRGTVRPGALDRLEAEAGNLRAALAWRERQGDAAALLDLAADMTHFWGLRGFRIEGRRWLEHGLAMDERAIPPAILAAAFHAAAALGRTQEDPARAVVFAEAALARFRALGDDRNVASAIHVLAIIERSRGNFERAAPLHEEAALRFRELGEPFWVALSACNLGLLAHWQGDDRRAAALLDEAIDAFCVIDDPWGVGLALSGLGLVVGDGGDHARAAALHAESLCRLREVGSQEILVDAVARVATLAAATGRAVDAARLLGAVEANSQALGYVLECPELRRYARAAEDARALLGDDALEAAWTAGHALSLDDAVAEAQRLVAEPVGKAAAGLTPRESEVLRLLAAGQSNREIGERLFISPATVARHLANLYAKLGVDSRAKATAYAHRHDLG